MNSYGRTTMVIAAISVVVAVIIGFTPVTAESEHDCGSVLAPKNPQSEELSAFAEAFDESLGKSACDDARSDRRTLSLIALVVGGITAAGYYVGKRADNNDAWSTDDGSS